MNCPNKCTYYRKPIKMLYSESVKVFSCSKCHKTINLEDLPHCSGCADPDFEGTHQDETQEHYDC